MSHMPYYNEGTVKASPMRIVNDYHEERHKIEEALKEAKAPGPVYGITGGPSKYYDMPFQEWVTTNDMMEYLAEHKWGKFGIHLKDIFKGLCRWGDKSGTDTLYDTKKIIYYGCRVFMMMCGKQALRAYLYELLDDKQFGGVK